MPELSLPIRRRGLLVKVLIRPASPHPLTAVDRPALAVGPLSAYVDTGASDTLVEAAVAESLGLQPARSAALNVLGREGVSFHDAYEVELAIALADGPPCWLPLTVLSGAVYPTGAVVALGRDFLRHMLLTYDGPAGRATLRWAESVDKEMHDYERPLGAGGRP